METGEPIPRDIQDQAEKDNSCAQSIGPAKYTKPPAIQGDFESHVYNSSFDGRTREYGYEVWKEDFKNQETTKGQGEPD